MKKIIAVTLFVILLILDLILFGVGWLKVVFSTIQDWAPTFNEILQALAIIIGGWWTYHKFVLGRLSYPQANIEHDISSIILDEHLVLVKVQIIISNIGNTLLTINECDTRIMQLKPVPASLSGLMEKNSTDKQMYLEKSAEIAWDVIVEHIQYYNIPDYPVFEVEPNESDELIFDFVIDKNIETVLIYSHIYNITKKKPIGWVKNTVHNINKEG